MVKLLETEEFEVIDKAVPLGSIVNGGAGARLTPEGRLADCSVTVPLNPPWAEYVRVVVTVEAGYALIEVGEIVSAKSPLEVEPVLLLLPVVVPLFPPPPPHPNVLNNVRKEMPHNRILRPRKSRTRPMRASNTVVIQTAG